MNLPIPTTDGRAQLKIELKEAIVRGLRLPISPGDIDDVAPLFGEGLGLDSIDVLEVVLELERSFGVQVRDEETGTQVLQSIETLTDFVMRQRATNSG